MTKLEKERLKIVEGFLALHQQRVRKYKAERKQLLKGAKK